MRSKPVGVGGDGRHKRFYEKVIKVKADVAALLIFLFFVAFATFPQKLLR
jgi:hypothetical protein